MKVGFAITSSFCTLKEVLVHIATLKSIGYDILSKFNHKINTVLIRI